jgi:transcriptional regulator with XRE-family HTH domain
VQPPPNPIAHLDRLASILKVRSDFDSSFELFLPIDRIPCYELLAGNGVMIMLNCEHEVYFHHNYFERFIRDLRRARYLVILQSPYLGIEQVSRLMGELKRCMERGVRVCVFVQEANPKYKQDDWRVAATKECVARLETIGVHVNYRPLIHEKIAIFDEFACWEGTLNFLSHSELTERINRWDCPHKREEIIDSHRLDTCGACGARASGFCLTGGANPKEQKDIELQLREIRVQLGVGIEQRRKNFKMSQEELADAVGLNQSDISKIELGKSNAKLDKILLILRALRMGVRVAPRFLLPVLDNALEAAVSPPSKHLVLPPPAHRPAPAPAPAPASAPAPAPASAPAPAPAPTPTPAQQP